MIAFSIKAISEQEAVICLDGDLDIDSTEVVEENILPEMESYSQITFDFSKVPFVDSSGMGLLLNIVHALHDQHKSIKIINVNEDVQIVFDLLQIPEIIGEDIFL
ncbi:STAS domain-containing protein [Domibacillus enclensis]|uniref:Anti-sigma B factor antagonist/stage II sporulation protein AA (Anti-sigma F factor antagonist) n=1 Tax=Domibacillus enclensis TaxID=1017273 RepID=A0A1N7AAI6_9BACI|nr:STAS domain-containing protein [Domibacillus enclensis]OXS75754.1 hypothetical protein B1B05_14575 [Domibacillus enclensis]SIR36039.1 anti-sigma B factor antagonist/stage II sporulation protein AA (anti-sigma F factor antagonist) [Domibacillus enclensis]